MESNREINSNLFHERHKNVGKAWKTWNQRFQSNTRYSKNMQIHHLQKFKIPRMKKHSISVYLLQHNEMFTCTVAFNPNFLTATMILGFAAHFTESSMINSFSSVS